MTVHFIGAGPGAPDLITLRGLRHIQSCPVCLYAGSLVPEAIVKAAPEDARVIDTAPLHLDEIVAEIEAAHAAGKAIARVHSGDPSIYGAIAEQMRRLDALGIPYDVSGSALSGVRPGLGQVLGVASVVMRARRALRRSPLRANLERRRAALGHGLARLVDRRETALRAAVYHAARPFAPAGRVCLLDSLALIDWLGDDAGQAQLVLSVTAYPFGAHCWVQTRQALLGDAPDTIARYAPILHLG